MPRGSVEKLIIEEVHKSISFEFLFTPCGSINDLELGYVASEQATPEHLAHHN